MAVEFYATTYIPSHDAPYIYYVMISYNATAPADIFMYSDGSSQVCIYQSAYDASLDVVIRKLADTVGYLAYTYNPAYLTERSITVALRDLLASLDYDCELCFDQKHLYIPIYC